MARPLDEAWPNPIRQQMLDYRANLLLNGTLARSAERSGERAVTSNLRLEQALHHDILNPAS